MSLLDDEVFNTPISEEKLKELGWEETGNREFESGEFFKFFKKRLPSSDIGYINCKIEVQYIPHIKKPLFHIHYNCLTNSRYLWHAVYCIETIEDIYLHKKDFEINRIIPIKNY